MARAEKEGKRTIAVIGAGIVGVASAVWLARDGHKVTLIDRLEPGEGTSYGNAGVLASCSITPVTTPGLLAKAPAMLLNRQSPLFMRWSYFPRLLPWLVRYLKHCNADANRRIAEALAGVIGDSLEQHQALAKGTPAERWLMPSDYVFLYADRQAYEADAFIWQIRAAHGFRGEIIEGDALRDYDPLLGPANRFAVRLDNHGHIRDPGQYVKDLAAHLQSLGGSVRRAEVKDFRFEGGVLTGLETDQGVIACNGAVVATGAWSKDLSQKLGLKIPLESERGYHMELENPSQMPTAPTMVAAGKFVATPMAGRIRLAGIVEFGGLEAGPSTAPYELLERELRRAMPALTWNGTKRWMGHRPAPADSIPIIGTVPDRRDVLMAFGHHHVGLTGGPKTGRLIADLISDRRPNVDLSPYAPSRFAS